MQRLIFSTVPALGVRPIHIRVYIYIYYISRYIIYIIHLWVLTLLNWNGHLFYLKDWSWNFSTKLGVNFLSTQSTLLNYSHCDVWVDWRRFNKISCSPYLLLLKFPCQLLHSWVCSKLPFLLCDIKMHHLFRWGLCLRALNFFQKLHSFHKNCIEISNPPSNSQTYHCWRISQTMRNQQILAWFLQPENNQPPTTPWHNNNPPLPPPWPYG